MADAKPAKDKSTMSFIVIVLLLSLIGAGAGFAVGSIVQTRLSADSSKPEIDSAKAEAAVAAKETHEAPASDHAGNKASDKAHGSAELAAADDEDIEVEPIDPRALRVVPFPPVLTTLAEPKGKWIRLEGSILTTTDAEDSPEVLAGRSGEQVLAYLRSLRLDQIEGPSNVLGLREDLNEMLGVLSRGQVKGILINGLVVE